MNGTILLRYSGWGRVLLAVAALGVNLALGSPLLLDGAIALFLVYAVAIAFRSQGLRGLSGLLVLFGDLLFFLFVAGSSPAALWIAPAVFLYLLAEALIFYSPIETAVVVGICAVFCSPLSRPSLRALEPAVLVAGALGCSCSFSRQSQKRELEALNRRVVGAETEAAKAREEERQRIASDFHDGPLQSFISLQMRLEILRKLLDRDIHAGMAGPQAPAGAGAIPGARPAHLPAQHAARGCGRRQPGGRGPPHRRNLPEGKRHPGDFCRRQRARGSAAGDDPRGPADAPRGAAQRAEARRRHARGGRHGEDRPRAWRFRWTTTATASPSPAPTRWKNWNCCGWVRPA